MGGFKEVSPDQLHMLAELPALQPPPGVVPNFVDPVTNAHQLVGVVSVLLALMILFALNRFYTKIWITKKFTWDDRRFLMCHNPYNHMKVLMCPLR